MRRNSKVDPRVSKDVARRKYAERQIDKWVKWSFEIKGKVKYSELLEMQEQYGIKCYGS